jgi:4'-phosphopantetheinyl transferase
MLFPSPHPDILCLLQSLDAAQGLANGLAPAGLLAPEERERYETFRVPKRRRDWLLGRWTAKQLGRLYLTLDGAPRRADEIVVRADSDGSP